MSVEYLPESRRNLVSLGRLSLNASGCAVTYEHGKISQLDVQVEIKVTFCRICADYSVIVEAKLS